MAHGGVKIEVNLDKSKLQGSMKGLEGEMVKSMAIFEVMKQTLTKVFGMITDSVDQAMRRIDTMDQFSRVMTTMTGSTDKANAALERTNAIVQGTAFGLDTAAKGVQAFVASGMEVSKATDTMEAWGDAVAFYTKGTNAELETVSAALQKMQTKGNVTMEHMQMMLEAGIPAIQIYASAVGKSTEEVTDQMSKGELKTEDFIVAMNGAFKTGTAGFPAIAGAAKQAGASWQGSQDNMKAAIARGTAAMLEQLDAVFDVKGGMVSFGKTMEKVLKGIAENLTAIIPTTIAVVGALIAMTKGPAIVAGFKTFIDIIKTAIATIKGLAAGSQAAASAITFMGVVQKIVNGVMATGNVIVTAAKTLALVMTGATWAEAAATTGLAGAWTALNVIILASPLGWILLAIVAVTAAIAGIVNAVKNANKEYYAEKDALKDLKEEHEGYADALRDSKDAAAQDGQEKVAQAQHNRQLMESLAGLVDETGKLTGEQDKAQSVISELNSNVAGLGLAFDETTGQINMSADELREYGENLEVIAKAEAAQGEYNNMLAEQQSLQAKINTLEAKKEAYNTMLEEGTISQYQYNKLVKEADKLLGEYGDSMGDVEIEVDALRIASEDAAAAEEIIANRRQDIARMQERDVKKLAYQYGISFEQILNEASKLEGGLEEWADNQASLFTESGMDLDMVARKWGMTTDEVQGYLDEWGMSLDEFNVHMEETHTKEGLSLEQLAAKWGTTTDAIKEQMAMQGVSMQEWSDNQDQAWADFQNNVAEHTDAVINSFKEIPAEYEMSADEMIEVLRKNRERYAEWKQTMTEISGQVSAETLAELEKLGPGALSAIQEMQANGGEGLREFDAEIRGIVGESTDYVVGEMNSPEFTNAGANMMGNVGTGMTSSNVPNEAAQAVADGVVSNLSNADYSAITEAMATAIKSGTNAVQSSAQSMARAVTDVLRKLATDSGTEMKKAMTLMASSINTGRTQVVAAMTAAMNAVKTAARTVANTFNVIGELIITKIKSGVDGHASAMSSSITAVMNAAKSAANAANTGWENIGYNMVAGMASGVRNNESILTSAIKSVVNAAIQAAKTAAVIQSPSRAFRDQVGRMIPLGIAEGVSDETLAAVKSVKNMTNQLIGASSASLTAKIAMANAGASGCGGSTQSINMGGVTIVRPPETPGQAYRALQRTGRQMIKQFGR